MIQFKHFQTGEVLAMVPEFPFNSRISSAANYAEAVRRILYSDKSDRVEGWVYQDGQPVGYLWYDPTMSMAEYEEEMDNEALDVVTFSEEGEDGTLLGVAAYEVWNRPTMEECDLRVMEAEAACIEEQDDLAADNVCARAGFDVYGTWPYEAGFDPLEDKFFDKDAF